MRPVVFAAVVAAAFHALPAFAQSTTVSASLIGNIVRADSLDAGSILNGVPSRDGESLGIALRVTQALNDRWGLELELGVPADIEQQATRTVPTFLTPEALPIGFVPANIEYRTTQRQQYLTIGTTAWFRQTVGDRTALVYSAGIGMTRLRQELEYEVNAPPFVTVLAPSPPTTSVSYGIAPLLGFDVQFELSSRARLIGGLRVQPHSSVWLIRPGIGVGWKF